MTTPISNIPKSTVSAAKKYLFAAITANVTTDETGRSPYVGLNQPGVNLPPDIILVGEVRRTPSAAQIVGSGGAGWMQESYEVDVTVSSARGGDERIESDLMDRAWDLANTVEAVVRSDPSLGGLVTVAKPYRTVDQSPVDPEHKGREYLITVTISVLNLGVS